MRSRHPFLQDEAKAALKKAVETVESQSAAEVVVSIRPWSGSYRQVDYLLGALLSFVGLCYMLYAERVFALHWIAVLCPMLFICGVMLSLAITPLRRLIAGRRALQNNVNRASRAQFYDLGVSRTRDRSGILVYVSLLERRCDVLPDIGVQMKVPADQLAKALAAIKLTIEEHGVTLKAAHLLAQAVGANTELLAQYLPRRSDDINELLDLAE